MGKIFGLDVLINIYKKNGNKYTWKVGGAFLDDTHSRFLSRGTHKSSGHCYIEHCMSAIWDGIVLEETNILDKRFINNTDRQLDISRKLSFSCSHNLGTDDAHSYCIICHQLHKKKEFRIHGLKTYLNLINTHNKSEHEEFLLSFKFVFLYLFDKSD